MNTMNRTRPTFSLTALVLMITLLCAPTLHAAVLGVLKNVSGPVDIMANGKLPAKPAQNDIQVSSGDLVRTKTGGFAEVRYNDGTVLRIAQRSRIDIGEHFSGKTPDSSEVKLVRGKVQALVDLSNVKTTSGAKRFEVRTPNAIAGVRGTDYIVSFERDITNVLLNSGSVYVYNIARHGEIINLTPGQFTTIYGDNAPMPPHPANDYEKKTIMNGLSPGLTSKTDPIDGFLATDAYTAGTDTTLPTTFRHASEIPLMNNLIKGTVSPTTVPAPPPSPAINTGSVKAEW